MGAQWRFVSFKESRQVEDRTTVLEITDASSLLDLLQQTKDCDTPVTALRGICKKVASFNSELAAGTIFHLSWCLYTHKHPEILFDRQIAGGYDGLVWLEASIF